MIHRALLGSMERFVGILIEHYGGRVPGSGWRRCRRSCCRSPTATTSYAARGRRRSCAARACAPRSTSAPSRSAEDPRRRARARCPTCWSSATARRRPAAVSRALATSEGDLGAMRARRASPPGSDRELSAGRRSRRASILRRDEGHPDHAALHADRAVPLAPALVPTTPTARQLEARRLVLS